MYSQPADNKRGDMIGNVLFNSFTTVYTFLCLQMQSKWGSSVSIVFDCGLDDWVIGVQSSAEAKDFPCSLCVQTSSGANPASYPMGAGGPFPGVTHGRGVMLTTHPIQCRGQECVRAIPLLPPSTFMVCIGTALLYF
jgi:hypothetical protein